MEEVDHIRGEIIHDGTLPHREFNFDRHGHLYIDLENLPDETPLETEFSVGLPVFLVAPIEVLRLLTFSNKGNFLFEVLPFSSLGPCRDKPTPYNYSCTVCFFVRWLLNARPTYEEAVHCLSNQEPTVVFEVAREIWCRLHVKPLRYRKYIWDEYREFHIKPLLDVYFDEETDTDLQDDATKCIYMWVNFINFITHVDFLQNPSIASCDALAFIGDFLIFSLRDAACNFPEFKEEHSSCSIFLLAAFCKHEEMFNIISQLSKIVAPALTAFNDSTWLESPSTTLMSYCQNILLCNSTEVYSLDLIPMNLLSHIRNAGYSMECTCVLVKSFLEYVIALREENVVDQPPIFSFLQLLFYLDSPY